MQFKWQNPFYVTLFLPEEWETWCFWWQAVPAQRFVGRGRYDEANPYPFPF